MSAETKKKISESDKLADALLAVMGDLSGILEQEIVCLKKRDLEAMDALRAEKARLVRDYQLNVGVLMQKPDFLKTTDQARRDKLRAQSVALRKTSERNIAGIKAALGATQSFIQTVVSMARKENVASECYADPRKNPLMLGGYSPTCSPVAVSRTA